MNLKELYIIKLDVVHINVNAELNIKIYSNIKLLYTMYVLHAHRYGNTSYFISLPALFHHSIHLTKQYLYHPDHKHKLSLLVQVWYLNDDLQD